MYKKVQGYSVICVNIQYKHNLVLYFEKRENALFYS